MIENVKDWWAYTYFKTHVDAFVGDNTVWKDIQTGVTTKDNFITKFKLIKKLKK